MANNRVDNINKYARQYQLFEGFAALLLTSPSTEVSLEDLAGHIITLFKIVWRTDQLPDKVRRLFVYAVLGDYLYCYQCERYGAKFIVNKKP